MAYRILQLHMDKSMLSRLDEMMKDPSIIDHWVVEEGHDRQCSSFLVKTENAQILSDKLQTFFEIDDDHAYIGVEKTPKSRLIVLPVETVLPKEKSHEQIVDKRSRRFSGISREELYEEIAKGAKLDTTFLWLTVLSTIVAAIGLLENNVAVIIGAMVIAPLLGPNLALALATSLGDKDLMLKSVKTNLTGVGIAFVMSFILGLFWTQGLDSPELLARTHVGFDGIILAIVSGAAAVLSLTNGVSGVLVGVMVAVALLPPTATFGIMLGAGQYEQGLGALLLLMVNIVSVNLSAKLVFLSKGVAPRAWFEKQKAQKAMKYYIGFWGGALLLLAVLVWLVNL